MTLSIQSGRFKGRKIKSPISLSTRPSSGRCRAAVFNICQMKVEGSNFLDLYAGSGAMGIEAISRGARSSCFIECSKEAIKCIQDNISLFKIESEAKVIYSDVFKGLKKVPSKRDIIYIDPPYKYYEKTGFIEASLSKLVFYNLLYDEALIFFEAPRTLLSSSIEKELVEHMELINIRKYGSSLLIEIKYQL